jgi:hypothetical protein
MDIKLTLFSNSTGFQVAPPSVLLNMEPNSPTTKPVWPRKVTALNALSFSGRDSCEGGTLVVRPEKAAELTNRPSRVAENADSQELVGVI